MAKIYVKLNLKKNIYRSGDDLTGGSSNRISVLGVPLLVRSSSHISNLNVLKSNNFV